MLFFYLYICFFLVILFYLSLCFSCILFCCCTDLRRIKLNIMTISSVYLWWSTAPNGRPSHVSVLPAAARGRHVTRKWRHRRLVPRLAEAAGRASAAARRRPALRVRGKDVASRRGTILDGARSKTFLLTQTHTRARHTMTLSLHVSNTLLL